MTIEELLKNNKLAEIKVGDHSMKWNGDLSEWQVILWQGLKRNDGVVVFSGTLDLALAILEKMGK